VVSAFSIVTTPALYIFLTSVTAESRRRNVKVWGKRLEIYSISMTIRVLMVLACDVTGRNRPIRPRWQDDVGRRQPTEPSRFRTTSGRPRQRLSWKHQPRAVQAQDCALLRLRCWISMTCSSVPKIEYRRVEVARRSRARPTVEPTGKGSHTYSRG
jgi:hypothetical protein